MRYLTIPKTVHLKNMKGKLYDEPLLFVAWVVDALLNSNYWSKGDERLLASADIEERLEGGEPGDVIQMAEDEWEHLCAALKESTFLPHEGRQIKTYIRAIKNAPNKRPKEPAELAEPEPAEEDLPTPVFVKGKNHNNDEDAA